MSLNFSLSGIPLSLRFAFQEYDLERLHLETDAFTIIERTLAYGSRIEIRWLFTTYGRQRLLTWLDKGGWRTLPRQRQQLWLTYFNLKPVPPRHGPWPH